MAKVIVAYVPVLHNGYLTFFDRHTPSAEAIFLVDERTLALFNDEFDYLRRKDALRALPYNAVRLFLEQQTGVQRIAAFNLAIAEALRVENVSVVCPDEDITKRIAEKYLKGLTVEFDSIFLRWHRDNVEETHRVSGHRSIPVSTFDKEMMRLAKEEASKSFDWWRQVGGVLVKEGKPVLVAHNQHIPDEQLPYAIGDPRSIFKRGIHIELSTAEHAEAMIIAEAARRGIKTKGSSLYVTAFPCPPCAKLVASAGIAKCYFTGGYAILDGESVLKEKGVELIYVNL